MSKAYLVKCELCLWSGQCYAPKGCDDFSPIEEDIDILIERNRYEFREYWYEEYEDLSE